MSWMMRHEGSPNVTSGLKPNDIIRGLNDGVWEISDEVRGPGDTKWHALEEHPHFTEALSEYEEPKKKHEDGEEHLDMNPLIDVALVLLIFFILTTSYDALKKVITMPSMTRNSKTGVPRVTEDKAKAEFCIVKAKVNAETKATVFEVDGQVVEDQHLQTAISVAVSQNRDKVVIDAEDAPWGAVVRIIDAARGARATKFMMRVSGVD